MSLDNLILMFYLEECDCSFSSIFVLQSKLELLTFAFVKYSFLSLLQQETNNVSFNGRLGEF